MIRRWKRATLLRALNTMKAAVAWAAMDDEQRAEVRKAEQERVNMERELESHQRRMFQRVLARLPYQPTAYVTRVTHRGLEGKGGDNRDVSVLFIYILCSLCVRGNVQKFFGNGPPKAERGWTHTM